jgi:hypothetical protein
MAAVIVAVISMPRRMGVEFDGGIVDERGRDVKEKVWGLKEEVWGLGLKRRGDRDGRRSYKWGGVKFGYNGWRREASRAAAMCFASARLYPGRHV